MVKRVIVADDDFVSRAKVVGYVKEAFHAAGIDGVVDEVSDGMQLVERILSMESSYDLAFTDNYMGKCNGLMAVLKIREEGNTAVPIYVLAVENVRDVARAVGANGYFSKENEKALRDGIIEAVGKHLK